MGVMFAYNEYAQGPVLGSVGEAPGGTLTRRLLPLIVLIPGLNPS